MKKLFLTGFALCVVLLCSAQNFVVNPQFDSSDKWPRAIVSCDNVTYARPWSCTDTIDPPYITYCAPEYYKWDEDTLYEISGRYECVPPHSGKGMMHVRSFVDVVADPDKIRDYLQGRFRAPLVAGRGYCVTFYGAFSNLSGYTHDKFGAYVDNGSIDTAQYFYGCSLPQTAYHPQAICTSAPLLPCKWGIVKGHFIASGDERFITIGTFAPQDSIHRIQQLPFNPLTEGGIGWLLIDDVSVFEDTLEAHAWVKFVEGNISLHAGNDDSTSAGMPYEWYDASTGELVGTGPVLEHTDTGKRYILKLDGCIPSYDTLVSSAALIRGLTIPKIELYPNPVNSGGIVSIRNSRIVELNDPVLVNIFGQSLPIAEFHQNNFQVPLSLPKGRYMVRCQTADGPIMVGSIFVE